MNAKPPFHWFRFWVQFAFGAAFGAGAGLVALAHSSHAGSPSFTPACCYAGVGAVTCGLLAGIAGDEFWRNIR